jgi:hypothetical protein
MHTTAELLHQRPDDEKPETRAPALPDFLLLDAIKAVKDSFQILPIDPDPIVAHLEQHPVVRISPRYDLDVGWVLGVLGRVVDQVLDDYLERRTVGRDHEPRVDVDGHFMGRELVAGANGFGASFGELR